MQRGHVLAVKVDLLLHPLVQERLEHLENGIERPVLVDDVYGDGAHRHARHHQADDLLRHRRTHLQAVVQRETLEIKDSHATHHGGDGLQGANLQDDQRGPEEIDQRHLGRLPVAESVDHQAASHLVAVRRHGDDVLVADDPQV